jgi:D-alanyl-lipoteichoic acid acyltransferase DltB (MBOAT superfamily)
MPGTKFIYQLGHYQPFWGGSNTPFPKGAAYLRKIEAKNAEELAISQLKGIKLLYWAFILSIVLGIFKMVVYGRPFYNLALPVHLAIPSVNDALAHTRSGEPYHWYINWAVVLVDFTKAMLTLSIWGHIIIATVRMAGFKALRNTWSPLQSKTIAEFWNRYYYYFKELLVEFFFYPTFLKYFKTRPRLRMFMATMAAAGLGNMLYHFLRDIHIIMELGIWGALQAFQVYIFYGLLLGTAIGLSQLRNQQRKPSKHWFRTWITAPVTILGFYGISHIFGLPYPGYGLDVYFQFLMHMINIGVT